VKVIPPSKAEDSKPKRRFRGARRGNLASPDRKEHILIVDDEKWIIQLGQEILERLGYQVTGRNTAREALETVRQQPEKFDLVITDFAMPMMDGVELAQELSRLCPGVPIILYTGSNLAISPENAKQIGIAANLLKPVTAAEMQATIRRVLDAKLLEGASSQNSLP